MRHHVLPRTVRHHREHLPEVTTEHEDFPAERHAGCVHEVAWCSEIMDATDEWRRAEDVIGRFLADCVTLGTGQRVKGSELFGAWKVWCEDENRPPGQAKNFHRRFQDHNEVIAAVEVLKPKGSIAYDGAGLMSPWG